ncbi:hypothetical protein SDC9_79089 [bioreactor metagenome]|uniref:Uncharacterized protein n=1 Tax=bioreactor metagenome TaxID=1076179 RepID=A0A644YVF7_9ZZZZ
MDAVVGVEEADNQLGWREGHGHPVHREIMPVLLVLSVIPDAVPLTGQGDDLHNPPQRVPPNPAVPFSMPKSVGHDDFLAEGRAHQLVEALLQDIIQGRVTDCLPGPVLLFVQPDWQHAHGAGQDAVSRRNG